MGDELPRSISYIPYGEIFVEESDNKDVAPYRFNAKELDEETGLYYYGARYLDPTSVGWLSVDPLFEKYVGMSPYNYCAGNPVVMVDPDGREKVIAVVDIDIRRAANSFTHNKDVIHYWGHGIESKKTGKCVGLLYEMLGEKKTIKTVNELNDMLMESSDVYRNNVSKNEKSVLVLHSCKTGEENAIAQKASKELPLLVVAPSDNVHVTTKKYRSGKITSEELYIENNGVWNVYYKGELMESFNGTTKPVFSNSQMIVSKYEKMWQEKHKSHEKDSD